MKKILCTLLALTMVVPMLAACQKKESAASGGSVTLNPGDFETDRQLILLADMPPNPFDGEAVQLYKDMGFTHWVLTEDDIPMVYEGGLHDGYKEAIEILSEQGFEVWIRNMQNDPDYFQLDEKKSGSNYGYQYTLEPRNITTEFSEFPAVTGFYMMDEPFLYTKQDNPATEDREDLHPAIDQLEALVAWKNQYYPDAFWHINHIGSGSWDHWPAGSTYEDFINGYVETVLKKLESGGRSICMDNYPLPDGGGVIKEAFLHDVLVLAFATKNYNASADADDQAVMGICLQTFQDTNLKLRDITSANDVTFQIYTGLACGAELFEYFCYRSLEGVGLYGILDMTGGKRIYDHILAANERALPFQKVCLAFEWDTMIVNHGNDSGLENIFDAVDDMTVTSSGVLKKMESRYDAIAGCFKKGEQDGYMVVNYTAPDLNQTNVITLTFEGCTTALVYTEEGVKQVELVEGGLLRLTLNAGQAAFVIPA